MVPCSLRSQSSKYPWAVGAYNLRPVVRSRISLTICLALISVSLPPRASSTAFCQPSTIVFAWRLSVVSVERLRRRPNSSVMPRSNRASYRDYLDARLTSDIGRNVVGTLRCCQQLGILVFLEQNVESPLGENRHASSILVARSPAASIKDRQHSEASTIAQVTHEITHKRQKFAIVYWYPRLESESRSPSLHSLRQDVRRRLQ